MSPMMPLGIPSGLVNRVFRIKIGSKVGSAFILDHADKQYIATAKHILDDGMQPNIEIYRYGNFVPMDSRVVGFGTADVDVAVFALSECLLPRMNDFDVLYSSDGVLFGQDAYILGFPGIGDDYSMIPRSIYPMPIVKKCYVAHMKGSYSLYDGINCKGFSGGPIVFYNSIAKKYSYGGVVSGYANDVNPVLKMVDGNLCEADNGLYYTINTGLIRVYNISCCLDLIKKNPIGPRLIEWQEFSYPSQ